MRPLSLTRAVWHKTTWGKRVQATSHALRIGLGASDLGGGSVHGGHHGGEEPKEDGAEGEEGQYATRSLHDDRLFFQASAFSRGEIRGWYETWSVNLGAWPWIIYRSIEILEISHPLTPVDCMLAAAVYLDRGSLHTGVPNTLPVLGRVPAVFDAFQF